MVHLQDNLLLKSNTGAFALASLALLVSSSLVAVILALFTLPSTSIAFAMSDCEDLARARIGSGLSSSIEYLLTLVRSTWFSSRKLMNSLKFSSVG